MATPRLPHLANKPSKHPGRDVRMAELAEWMAENGGRVRDAAKALGWSYDRTKHVWHRILRRLGAQAI